MKTSWGTPRVTASGKEDRPKLPREIQRENHAARMLERNRLTIERRARCRETNIKRWEKLSPEERRIEINRHMGKLA